MEFNIKQLWHMYWKHKDYFDFNNMLILTVKGSKYDLELYPTCISDYHTSTTYSSCRVGISSMKVDGEIIKSSKKTTILNLNINTRGPTNLNIDQSIEKIIDNIKNASEIYNYYIRLRTEDLEIIGFQQDIFNEYVKKAKERIRKQREMIEQLEDIDIQLKKEVIKKEII